MTARIDAQEREWLKAVLDVNSLQDTGDVHRDRAALIQALERCRVRSAEYGAAVIKALIEDLNG